MLTSPTASLDVVLQPKDRHLGITLAFFGQPARMACPASLGLLQRDGRFGRVHAV